MPDLRKLQMQRQRREYVNIGNKIFSFFIRLEHAARKVKALIDSL